MKIAQEGNRGTDRGAIRPQTTPIWIGSFEGATSDHKIKHPTAADQVVSENLGSEADPIRHGARHLTMVQRQAHALAVYFGRASQHQSIFSGRVFLVAYPSPHRLVFFKRRPQL